MKKSNNNSKVDVNIVLIISNGYLKCQMMIFSQFFFLEFPNSSNGFYVTFLDVLNS